jgi:hypothetical protein
LELIEKGKFVDLTGTRYVSFEHGVWEFIWRRNAKAGAMICGFDVPEEVKRNGATIPKGRVYVVGCCMQLHDSLHFFLDTNIPHLVDLDLPCMDGRVTPGAS